MKSESPAKKHHFWILLGLVPLLTLIGVLMVSAKVGGKIDERQADIDKATKEISAKTSPKPNELIAKLDKVASVVDKKQTDLHKENWERQKGLFTWPRNSAVFKALEDRGLKFGDPIPDLTAVFNEFQRPEAYPYEYSSIKKGTSGPGTGMADVMAPTQFRNGWQQVLRYVNDFGQMATNRDQIWLILEDMWIQRSLLSGLRSVNTEIATFERVKYEQNGKVIDDPAKGAAVQNKTKRLFRSRNWELALEIVPEGAKHKLTGTLTNLSDRLQLMGIGNFMVLNAWLSTAPNAQPISFRVGGEYLPGKGAMKAIKDKDGNAQVQPANVLPIEDYVLPEGTDSEKLELARIEQVFDIRTVPIKRIDALVLGQLDSRNIAQPTLVPPRSPPFSKEFVGDPAAEVPTDGSSPMGPGSAGPMPSAPSGLGGKLGLEGGSEPGNYPGSPGATGAAGSKRGGGALRTVIDGNKKRYIAATDQVRRMPVGLVVVVDQSYMQDVLLALSNSPLRFQITQVTWTRFRHSLDGIGGGGSAGGSGNDIDYGMGGKVNFGGGDPDERGARPPSGGFSRPFGPAPGTGGTGVPGAPGYPGTGSPGPGAPGYSGSGSGYPGSNYPGSGSSVVSESQITSGLVELSVYGIVSLYEKYEAPKPADAAGAPTTPPAPDTPAPPTPPAPMEPAPTAPPKMRRRVRARGAVTV